MINKEKNLLFVCAILGEPCLGIIKTIIMFPEYLSPLVSYEGNGTWFEMVMTLKRYTEKNGYMLAEAFDDSPYNSRYYYVQSDFPESAEIINRI